VMLMVVAW